MKNFSIFSTIIFAILCLNFAAFGQVSITGTTPVTQNFDTIGSTATATLPSGWKVDSGTQTTIYANAATATTAAAGTSGTNALTGTSSGGTYNFANGVTASSTDRAVGWLTSGSFASPRQMFVQLTNNSGQNLTALSITFDIEKYRTGTRAFDLNFFSSTDGTNWTAQTSGDQSYTADTSNAVVNPPTTTTKSVFISNLNIANGNSIYLRWSYTGVGGNTNAQGLGIDNFSATATLAASPNVDLTIDRTAYPNTVGENGEITYSISVSNLGTGNATGVKARFVVPQRLLLSNVTTACGFTSSTSGSTVTFTGGTIPAGSSCDLHVTTNADGGGFYAIANLNDTVVDPDNTIGETNETNNTASSSSQVTVQFPANVVGLAGRTSLAQLMTDINAIGGVSAVNLDQDLVETSNFTIPDFVTLDFENHTVSGNINVTFGSGFGAGFRTTNLNGLGDAMHPGCLQVNQINFNGATNVEYYQFSQTAQELGTVGQTAYNNPALIRDFKVNSPIGLNIVEPFIVIGDFYLTNGIIYNGGNTITLTETTRINGENLGEGSETSFVVGKVQKYFRFFGEANGLATSFVFPVGTAGGDQNGYSPLKAIGFSAGAQDSSLTVQAFDTNPAGVRTPTLSRYWQIDETGDVTTTLQFRWREGDDSAITNPLATTIIRNGQNACDGNCEIDFLDKSATISGVSDFSPWSVAMIVPTAADSSIGGRVLNSRGRAETRAKVLLTDQNGNTKTVSTNNFGNFQFDGLRTGETYIVNVIAKQAQYNPRVITLNEDAVNLELIPQE